MKLGSLFSGIGGLELALESVGYMTAWQCEVDQYASQVLQRHWGVPNLGDITQVDWESVERVDALCGGFPCQDISTAGKGAGIAIGTRSGLWYEFAKCIGVLRPAHVYIENVSALAVRGLNIVLGDLAALGFNAEWGVVRASDVGAAHRRERLFIIASDPNQQPRQQWRKPAPRQTQGGWTWPDVGGSGRAPTTDTKSERREKGFLRGRDSAQFTEPRSSDQVATDSNRDTIWEQPEPIGRRSGEAITGWSDEATSDSDGTSRQARSGRQRAGDLGRQQPVGDHGAVAWGDFGPAIRRWEYTAGPAPKPTDDRGRLAPEFVEWMMGFPVGWTDGLPLSQRLKCLGNAVVPQCAVAAFTALQEMAAA
ncbi:MAG: DNA (cytosine-5-)-methyltransferase [Hyphomicrobiaceae bacterium]|nr:MAG: DNA (cytosine-5-)-methyltransferase [Hyphomicrobiaceae bacterium]